jgi:hypothetical protein
MRRSETDVNMKRKRQTGKEKKTKKVKKKVYKKVFVVLDSGGQKDVERMEAEMKWRFDVTERRTEGWVGW